MKGNFRHVLHSSMAGMTNARIIEEVVRDRDQINELLSEGWKDITYSLDIRLPRRNTCI